LALEYSGIQLECILKPWALQVPQHPLGSVGLRIFGRATKLSCEGVRDAQKLQMHKGSISCGRPGRCAWLGKVSLNFHAPSRCSFTRLVVLKELAQYGIRSNLEGSASVSGFENLLTQMRTPRADKELQANVRQLSLGILLGAIPRADGMMRYAIEQEGNASPEARLPCFREFDIVAPLESRHALRNTEAWGCLYVLLQQREDTLLFIFGCRTGI